MRYSVVLVVLCALCARAEKDDKKLDEKSKDKRGVVEVQGPTGYATAAPGLAISHGPTVLPAVTASPGIVYAPEKQILATASPSQIYAKQSPNLKISDVVLGQNHGYSGVINQLYQTQQAYQPLGKVSYAVSQPIPAQLAYQKHQIITPYQQQYQQQPVYHQQQPLVYHQQQQPIYHQQVYQHQQQPIYHQHQQPAFVHPQITHYAHPQQLIQPQQVYHAQSLAHPVYQQPQVQRVVPQIVAPQLYGGHQLGKVEGAVSYASFSQGHTPVQYAPKVNYAPQVVAQPIKQLVAAPAVQQPVYYHQPQLQHQVYPHGQEYVQQQQLFAPQARVYPQPQVAYATQYFGKIAQGSPIAYAGYNH